MMFGGLLFLALLIGLVAWLATSGRRSLVGSQPASDNSMALEIVKQRYARGEIDGDEYRRLLADLRT